MTASSVADPVLELYAEWREARDQWIRIAEAGPGRDLDAVLDAVGERETIAFEALLASTASTLKGLAALARVAWDVHGPLCAEGTQDRVDEMELPENRLRLAILRSAEGVARVS